jgi:hypothetical protein
MMRISIRIIGSDVVLAQTASAAPGDATPKALPHVREWRAMGNSDYNYYVIEKYRLYIAAYL